MTSNPKLLGPLPRPRTIADEVAERIILAIANGEQKPGERLTEGGLAEVLNVSRVPAREALQHLESIGIVVPLQRRGLRIVDFSQRQALEVREVRIALEAAAIKSAMQHVRDDPEMLEGLDFILQRMQTEFDMGDVLSLAQCDLDFHREMMRLSGNQLLMKFWEGLAPHLLIHFCQDWKRNRGKIGEVVLHQRLRTLIANGNVAEIEPELQNHFASAA